MRRTRLPHPAVTLLAALALFAAGAHAPAAPPEVPPAAKPSAGIQSILDEAGRLQQARKLPEALEASARALTAAREAKDAAGEAGAQRLRALLYQELQQTEEARAAWAAAAAAWEQAKDGPRRVEALAAQALLLIGDKPEEGRKLLGEAVAVAQAETRRPLAAAEFLDRFAGECYHQRRLVEARILWQAVLTIQQKKAPGSRTVAKTLHNLGKVTRARRDWGGARQYFEQALKIREDQAPNSLLVMHTLEDVANAVQRQGDPAGARKYFERALKIQEKQGPGSRALAKALHSLGVIAYSQGDLAGAREYFERALRIRKEQARDSVPLAQTLNSLGSVAASQGDLAGAKVYFEQALEILNKRAVEYLDLASSLNGLGNVARRRGDWTGAKTCFERALQIQQERAPDSLAVARTLNNLGVLADEQGDPARATEYLERALTIQEKLTPGSLAVAETLHHLGTVARRQGDHERAKTRYEQSLAIREKLAPGSLAVAQSLNSLGWMAYGRGDLVEAEKLAQQTWSVVQAQARAVTGDEARQAFGASTLGYAATLVRYQVAREKLSEAFATLEEGRAQALQQLLLERKADLRGVDPKTWAGYQLAVVAQGQAEQALAETSLNEARARQALAQAQQTTPKPDTLERLQAGVEAAAGRFQEAHSRYTEARLKTEELWRQVRKSAPGIFPQPVTLAEATAMLPPDTLFVAFSVGEAQTHLFLLPSGAGSTAALQVWSLPIGEAEVDKQVKEFAGAVAARDLDLATAGRALFARLFPPEARPAILAAKRLLLSPDGPLWGLPFAALVIAREGAPRYLGLEKPLTYIQSLTLFAQFRSGKRLLNNGSKPTVLAVGIASAGSVASMAPGERPFLYPHGGAADPLPWAPKEAAGVSVLYGDKPLTDAAATEAAVRQRLREADVVHMATHGYLHPYRGMSSCILLTAPKAQPAKVDSANDGGLMAWEIRDQLKLRAELVVLSACETGRGDIVRGEGMVGLTRALQYAGARSIVASQWPVADASTKALMVTFHRKLRQGLAKDEALRQAMLAVRQDPETAHLYYWAPFFLTGDPENPNLGVNTARE
jgi:CHAT domain-containing protein/tetratricopeptide (TPR) repeat protein